MARRFVRPLVRIVRGRYYYDWNVFPHVRSDDLYVVSYPRSGNTWVRCLLTSLVHDRPVTPELLQRTVPDVYRVRMAGPVGRRSSRHARFFKSHSPYQRLPSKVVYLLRDGRDVLLSYYEYLLRSEDTRFPGAPHTYDDPRDFYFAGAPHGRWHEHVLGWLDGLATWPRDRFLVLRYEDMLRDPHAALASIAELAEVPIDRERIERAVALNTTAMLAETERRSGEGVLNYLGVTRSTWRDVLSLDDLAPYEQLAGEALERAGYRLYADERDRRTA
jgi:Sulfotransferase domain